MWEHSPTRRKYRDKSRINRGAPFLSIALSSPHVTRAPLYPWALHLPSCHVAPHTGVHVYPSAWPPATRQRHLRVARATRVRHVASVPRRTSRRSRVPHQLPLATSACRLVNPFFAILNRKIQFKNQIKFRKGPKTSKIHNLKYTTPF